jgi:sugar fermentation stimulation protein A
VQYAAPLVRGSLLRREKRFSIHVRLDDGEEVVAHTNNTGSLRGCWRTGAPVWLSPAPHPRRKLPRTVEIIAAGEPPVLVGVNTTLANKLVHEGISTGVITELQGYQRIQAETTYQSGRSRSDFLLSPAPASDSSARVWVEVKNVSYVVDRTARFPDAVTARGRKHLHELAAAVACGERAILIFVVQRSDAECAGPADDIDPAYGQTLREAMDSGVEVIAYGAEVTLRGIHLIRRLPVVI